MMLSLGCFVLVYLDDIQNEEKLFLRVWSDMRMSNDDRCFLFLSKCILAEKTQPDNIVRQ